MPTCCSLTSTCSLWHVLTPSTIINQCLLKFYINVYRVYIHIQLNMWFMLIISAFMKPRQRTCQSQPRLHSELQVNLSYRIRPYLKNKAKQNKTLFIWCVCACVCMWVHVGVEVRGQSLGSFLSTVHPLRCPGTCQFNIYM